MTDLNSSMHLTKTLSRAVQIAGEKTATVYRERTRTWNEVEARVARLASVLQDFGVTKGASVAILAFNSDYYLEYVFAVWRLAAAVNPLNIRLSAPEMAYCLDDSETTVLLVDEEFLDLAYQIRGQCRRLDHVIVLSEKSTNEDAPAIETLIANADPFHDDTANGDDIAGIFYTGGTTGRAKGVLLTHSNLLLSALGGQVRNPGYDGDTLLHTAPLFHLSGAVSMIAGAGRAAQNVFMQKFDAGEALALIERYEPRSITLAPIMLQMMIDHPDFGKRNLEGLKTIVYGSAPMPEALLRRAIATLPAGTGFIQGYGMTEAAGALSFLGPEDHDPDGPHPERLKSAGRSTVLAEVKICDPEGREVPRGTVGEVCARTPTLMKGYLNQPEVTENAFRDGWYRSGDGGYMDENGYIYIVDRFKDMIVTGGENVYSAEVETVLTAHPAVAMCAVFGIPDPEWGEKVHADVLLQEGAEVAESDLIAHCRSALAGYKTPRSITIRTEPFPVTPAGKIQKNLIKAPYWEDRDRSVN